jgi:hypothetical protein
VYDGERAILRHLITFNGTEDFCILPRSHFLDGRERN